MSATNVRAGRAYVEIGADAKQLDTALAKVQSKLGKLGENFRAIGQKLIGVGSSIVAPLVAAGTAFAEMGNNIYRASQRTGVSVEALSGLGYAARQSGIGMEDLEGGFKKMQKAISGGTPETQEALAKLGLTVRGLAAESPEEQFKTLADAIAGVDDPTQRAGLAMKLFGKTGTALLPMFEEGAAGIQKLQDRAASLGVILGTDSAKAAAEFHERLQDVRDVIMNGVYRAGAAVAPILKRMAEMITKAGVEANKWITAHKQVFQTALKVGVGLIAAGGGFLAVGTALSLAGKAIAPFRLALSAVPAITGLIAPALTALLSPIGLIAGGLAVLGYWFVKSTDMGRNALAGLASYFGTLKDTAVQTFGGISDALAAGDWKLAAQVAWAGLKLAWVQGIAPLKKAWSDFKHFFVTVWEDATDAIARAVLTVFSKIQEIWANVKAMAEQAGNAAAIALEKREAAATRDKDIANLEKDIHPAVKKVAKGNKAEEDRMMGVYRQQIEDEYKARIKALDSLDSATKKEIEQNKKAAIAAVQAEHDVEMALLNQQHTAELAAIDATQQGEADAAAKDLADKMAALRKLRTEAANKREKKEADDQQSNWMKQELGGIDEAVNEWYKSAKKDMPDPGDEAANLDRKLNIGSTFNARGAFGLAGKGDSIAQQTAKNTLKIAKDTEKNNKLLQKIADTGGVKFGI